MSRWNMEEMLKQELSNTWKHEKYSWRKPLKRAENTEILYFLSTSIVFFNIKNIWLYIFAASPAITSLERHRNHCNWANSWSRKHRYKTQKLQTSSIISRACWFSTCLYGYSTIVEFLGNLTKSILSFFFSVIDDQNCI